jgi:hypothetical protein
MKGCGGTLDGITNVCPQFGMNVEDVIKSSLSTFYKEAVSEMERKESSTTKVLKIYKNNNCVSLFFV